MNMTKLTENCWIAVGSAWCGPGTGTCLSLPWRVADAVHGGGISRRGRCVCFSWLCVFEATAL